MWVVGLIIVRGNIIFFQPKFLFGLFPQPCLPWLFRCWTSSDVVGSQEFWLGKLFSPIFLHFLSWLEDWEGLMACSWWCNFEICFVKTSICWVRILFSARSASVVFSSNTQFLSNIYVCCTWWSVETKASIILVLIVEGFRTHKDLMFITIKISFKMKWCDIGGGLHILL